MEAILSKSPLSLSAKLGPRLASSSPFTPSPRTDSSPTDELSPASCSWRWAARSSSLVCSSDLNDCAQQQHSSSWRTWRAWRAWRISGPLAQSYRGLELESGQGQGRRQSGVGADSSSPPSTSSSLPVILSSSLSSSSSSPSLLSPSLPTRGAAETTVFDACSSTQRFPPVVIPLQPLKPSALSLWSQLSHCMRSLLLRLRQF